MTPIPYNGEAHYDELAGWWSAHGQEPVAPARLPVNGFVVPGLAAAFFYLTDTETAIFEYCVSNAEASKADVYAAIKAITLACFKRARELGYRHMTCLTPIPGIIEFAKREVRGARASGRGTDTLLEVDLDGTA